SEAPSSSSGARYLVAGSVQRESGELRINIHLVDTATNQQLWSERFARPFGDLFAVQDEIVRRLTELLPGKITDAERQRLANRYTRSLEAYDYFLRAQALFLVRQAGVNEEARNLYRKALDLDPKFARAYAGLAMTYAMDHRLRPPGEASTALSRAFELAESARMIDPEIPEVYWALAFVHVQSRRHEQAIESLQRAIELNRSFADAYAFMGGVYDYIGESSKSIPLLRTALRLNPDGGYLYYQILGRAYLFDNDIEQALINLREAVARNPVDLETRVHLAAALVASGDRAAAEWEAVEIRSLQTDFATRVWLKTYPLTSPKHRERLLHLLEQVGL
ncbi:MAG TPA: tetratricopeptide repeat protein, partial [Burkholderiaceae bacterium]|nr:tetratricopeptide repeat protein [Burkholderiaceae bacterium]